MMSKMVISKAVGINHTVIHIVLPALLLEGIQLWSDLLVSASKRASQ